MDNDSGLSSDAEDNNPPILNRKRKATSDSDGKSACSQKPKLIKTDSRELSSNSDDESGPENGREVGKMDKDVKSNSNLARKLKPEQYQMTLFEMENCNVFLVDVVNSRSKSLPVNNTQHIPEVANRLDKATFHKKSDSSIIQTSDNDSDSSSVPLKNSSKNMSLRKNKNLDEMSKKDAELLSDSDEEFTVSKKDISKNLKFNILTDSEEETEANQSGTHLKSIDEPNVEYTESKTTNTTAKFKSQRRHKKFTVADDDKLLQEETASASQTSSRVKSRMKPDKPNSDSEDESNEEQLKKESPLAKASMNKGSSDSSSEDESDEEFKPKSKIQSDADDDSDSDEPLKTKSRTSFKRSVSRPKVADSDSEDRSDKELARKRSLKSHQSDSDVEQLKKKSPISKSRRTSIKMTTSKREVLDSSSEDNNDKELSKKPKSKFQGSDVDEPIKKPPVIRSRKTSVKKRPSTHTDSDSEYATESDSDVVIEYKPPKKVQSDSVNESLVNKKAFSTKSLISKLKKYSSETNSDSENENTKASGSNAKVTNTLSSEHPAKRHHGRCSDSSGDSEIEGKEFSGAAKPRQSNSERDCTPNKQVLSSDKIKSQTSKNPKSLLVHNAASESDDEPLSRMKRNRTEESSGNEASSGSTYTIKRTKSASCKSASKKTKNLSRSEVNKPQTENSDSSEDEISLSKLKLENRKRKPNDDAMADEDDAERKRAGCSDGSSESGSDDVQTFSAGKPRIAAKETPTKKRTGQTAASKRKIAKLKSYIAASGLRVVYAKVLRDCKNMKAQVNKLLQILEDAGMKGPPTLKKCERLRHKREKRQEAEALDHSNILATPKGRSRRTRYKAPSTPQVPQNLLDTKPHTDTVPSKKIFSRLKEIVDSDDSSN